MSARAWCGLDGGEEGGHRDIVIARAEGGVGAVQRLESRIARLGRRQHRRDGEEDGEAHTTLEIVVVRPGRGSQGNLLACPCHQRLFQRECRQAPVLVIEDHWRSQPPHLCRHRQHLFIPEERESFGRNPLE